MLEEFKNGNVFISRPLGRFGVKGIIHQKMENSKKKISFLDEKKYLIFQLRLYVEF